MGDDQDERIQLIDFKGGIGYSERPTITFTPQKEQEFTRQLISPIELQFIYLPVNYGWDIDRVLRMMVNGMNGLRNDTLQQLIRLLKLDPSASVYRLRHAPGSRIRASENPDTIKDLMLSARSALAMIAHLSQGVSVPTRHVDSGVVAGGIDRPESANMIQDLLQIRVQPEKPWRASLAAP